MPEQTTSAEAGDLSSESYPTEVHMMVDRMEEIRDTLGMLTRADANNYAPVRDATAELADAVECGHCEEYLRGILAGIAYMQAMETAAPTETDPWDRKTERLEAIEKDITDWIENVGRPFIEDYEERQ